MKAPWVKTVEVCQHSAYRSASVDGILFCMCSACGAQWQVMLCPNGREFDNG